MSKTDPIVSVYQERLDAAVHLLDEHNKSFAKGSPAIINPKKFINTVKEAGGTNLERLAGFSHEDITECMDHSYTKPDSVAVKPRVLVKEIAKIFRGKDEVVSADPLQRIANAVSGIRVDKNKKISEMSLFDLVSSYDPADPMSKVGDRLKTLSRNQKFIVFTDDKTMNYFTTLKLLEEVMLGFDGRNTMVVDGQVKEVYKVGDRPSQFWDENPVYHGTPLRPDGTCDKTGKNWTGVPLCIRQLVYLAVGTREIDPTDGNIFSIIDLALMTKIGGNHTMQFEGNSELWTRYQRAALKYEQLKNTGSLPALKVSLRPFSEPAHWNKAGHPIKNGQPVNWNK